MNSVECRRILGFVLTASFAFFCAGCVGYVDRGNSTPPANPGPLAAGNINLIFVVSGDLDYQTAGDISASTGNLTNQGLQRSLLMAPFLEKNVLGMNNVTGIYALEPMTHQQTTNEYPDMAAAETIEQFALLNQITLSSNLTGGALYTGNNFPIYATYALGSVPSGVAEPLSACPNCQGLDFNDLGGDNETLITGIINAGVAGYYVFSAPWETTRSLLANTNTFEHYHLNPPWGFPGANFIYAISIPPSGPASLAIYNSGVNPPNTYPVLPPPALISAACTTNVPPSITVTVGVNGATIPPGANTKETLYFVRHAEAHPQGYWSDNNYVGAGQWRALDLPNALLGKVSPNQVWAGDISQFSIGTTTISGEDLWSGVAPALTVEPYAIANNLPYYLVSSFELATPTTTLAQQGQQVSNFFFTGGKFTGQKVLVVWSYQQINPIVNALLASYYPGNPTPPTSPIWSPTDYDSIWTLTVDGSGNLTADFTKCEGISSAALPAAAPQF
ncbi:MAG: hypothetical protein ABSD72_07225 [Terracidiphilus sp.]|jgi:hypothetical protein